MAHADGSLELSNRVLLTDGVCKRHQHTAIKHCSARGSPLCAVTRKVQAVVRRLEAVDDLQLRRHRRLRGHHGERSAELPRPPRGQRRNRLFILSVSCSRKSPSVSYTRRVRVISPDAPLVPETSTSPGLSETTTKPSCLSFIANFIVAMRAAALDMPYAAMRGCSKARLNLCSAAPALSTTIFLVDEARRSGRNAVMAWTGPRALTLYCQANK